MQDSKAEQHPWSQAATTGVIRLIMEVVLQGASARLAGQVNLQGELVAMTPLAIQDVGTDDDVDSLEGYADDDLLHDTTVLVQQHSTQGNNTEGALVGDTAGSGYMRTAD